MSVSNIASADTKSNDKKCKWRDFFKAKGIKAPFCHDLNCEKCHSMAANKKIAYTRKRLANIKGDAGHRSFILHLSPFTNENEILTLVEFVHAAFRRFDNKKRGVIDFVLHRLPGDLHLNVGLCSYYLEVGNLVGYWDLEKQKFIPASRKKKKLDWLWLQEQIASLVGGCVNKLKWGLEEHWDNHLFWLEYVLRGGYQLDRYDPQEGLKGGSKRSWKRRKENNKSAGGVIYKQAGDWKPSEGERYEG